MTLSQILFVLLPLACAAQTIQGNVRNGTTGKPEPGQQVILFTTSGEQARSVTNGDGEFRIETRPPLDPHSPAILQVTHGGVEYFQSVRSGQRASVKLYEAASKIDGISDYLTILQFQVRGTLLQVTELHALSNASNPPTTKVDPNNLVLALPEGSQVEPATVSGPDGGTLKLPLVLITGKRNQYRVDFPIKPGLTKYAVSYEVPYADELVFRRQAQYPIKRMGVIVPDSMRFRSLGAKVFHAVTGQSGSHEQELDGLGANERFAFELSGTGALAHSFRPLNPGGSSRSAGSKTFVSEPWSHAGSLGTSDSLAPARSGWVGRQVIFALGIVLAAGVLLWRMILRRARRAGSQVDL